MNDYILSILLGIIEGLTEFIPVSSTAHLRLAQALLGVDLGDGYWKMYAIVIQLGAILSLPLYFRDRIRELLRTFPAGGRGERSVFTHPLSLTVLAFVCTALPAFLLTRLIGKNLESLFVMGVSLVAGGVVMWLVDIRFADAGRTRTLDDLTSGQAVWVGFCQFLSALFPGTSRSMATIAGGQIAGMTRAAALEFSFFLSMPTMAAATLYDLFKSLRHGATGANGAFGTLTLDPHQWLVLALGFLVSFVVAYAVVAWFMHWVRKHGFVPFAVYRIGLGAAVLVWALRGTH
jgi:undecaprenyl-diphosphatase